LLSLATNRKLTFAFKPCLGQGRCFVGRPPGERAAGRRHQAGKRSVMLELDLKMSKAVARPSDTSTIKALTDLGVHETIEDRRNAPRFPFTATTEVVDIKSRTRMNARTSDLSRHGCYIDTQSPFPLHTKVRIRITNAKKSFETHATVVYSLPNMGMGLSFSTPEPEQQKILTAWIDDLSGESEANFDLSSQDDQPSAAAGQPAARNEHVLVLQELLLVLMQKGTLSETEGKALLQKLLR
jgi:hypothetical protein